MVFQMFPWESLPILRKQEVYRMPSVAGIRYTYDRCFLNQEKAGKDHVVCPMVDPVKGYYILNPAGNLPKTEASFFKFFEAHKLQVKVLVVFLGHYEND